MEGTRTLISTGLLTSHLSSRSKPPLSPASPLYLLPLSCSSLHPTAAQMSFINLHPMMVVSTESAPSALHYNQSKLQMLCNGPEGSHLLPLLAHYQAGHVGLNPSKLVPTSGLLHMPFPLSETLFPQIPMQWVPFSSLLKCHILLESFPAILPPSLCHIIPFYFLHVFLSIYRLNILSVSPTGTHTLLGQGPCFSFYIDAWRLDQHLAPRRGSINTKE